MNLQDIFLGVLNMSITAGWIIVVVVVFRMLLRGLPRVFSYILWAVVCFRLLCPFSFTSIASVLNLLGAGRGMSVPLAAVAEQNGAVLASSIDWALSGHTEIVPFLFEISLVWIIGVIAMLLYGVFSYLKLRKIVKTALPVGDGVYLCDTVDIPFVLGVFKPIIYLPTTIKDKEYEYILRHEQIHILRRDYIIKPIAYLALSLHWFNPLAWLSMRLMTCDMEMSCDEMVLSRMGEGIKRSYSNSLLQMSSEKPSPSLHMLAFGETDTKRRIKNVLKYKHPIGKNIAVAVCLVTAVSLAMLTNPAAAYASNKPVGPTPPIAVEPAPTATAKPESTSEPKEAVVIPLPSEEGAITINRPLGDKGYISAGIYAYSGHTGTDFAASEGTEIYAAQSGTVVYANNDLGVPYGKHIILDHGNGWQTLYAQCHEVLVKEGDVVAQGSLIAAVGKTGNATGPHCHFELRYSGEIVNPEDYIVSAE